MCAVILHDNARLHIRRSGRPSEAPCGWRRAARSRAVAEAPRAPRSVRSRDSMVIPLQRRGDGALVAPSARSANAGECRRQSSLFDVTRPHAHASTAATASGSGGVRSNSNAVRCGLVTARRGCDGLALVEVCLARGDACDGRERQHGNLLWILNLDQQSRLRVRTRASLGDMLAHRDAQLRTSSTTHVEQRCSRSVGR